ncbi:MAG TPA: response regulator [Kofleriaceae bacterium]|nr:response regulator [Kofleriaceae bacterium]
MSAAVELWDGFVAAGVDASAEVEVTVRGVISEELPLAGRAGALRLQALTCFQLGYQALLLGAEELGKLALACERGCDLLASGELAPEGTLILASSASTLATAFRQLANADRSGARTEGLPLAAATYELETLFPSVGSGSAAPDVPLASLRRGPAPPAAAASTPAPEPAPGVEVWVPTVDDDMIELFFEEANERLEELSVKLLEIEQRPGDVELLRDIFRDLHTIKGSSAMVGLDSANKLAHASEDLVGQLREGDRPVDGPVIDALLATLDGLRAILRLAHSRQPIALDLRGVLERLRNPAAAAAIPRSEASAHGTPGSDAGPAPDRTARTDRQTIRVDFDKLDRLMNLVGELVLGRDGLRVATQSLAAVSTELSSDRHLTRRVVNARRSLGGNDHQDEIGEVKDTLDVLGEELSRVERVLVDISQDLDRSTGRLDSVSGDLREQVMKLRMVPIGGVFRKHHRTVRDLAGSLGKRCKLVLAGEDTELDKLLVEALDEPLMHLVRNAVDHGIETPDARERAGKPAEGTVRLAASHRGNQVVIQISDDGKGLDPAMLRARARDRDLLPAAELDALDDRQVLEIIFRPGFSTAEQVSEVSGRGVGMDVVKQTIVTRLKGTIDIDSTLGEGSTFTLQLPLTLAIIQVVLARSGGEVFAIPLDPVVRTFTCAASSVQIIQDRETVAVGDRQVPLVRLDHVLELTGGPLTGTDELHVVLVEVGGEPYGLVCEHLLGKKEIVIKSLGDVLESVPCAAGATLLGERAAIILDVPAIVQRAHGRGAPPRPIPIARAAAPEPASDALHVLLVEDSEIVREALRRLLVDAGYRVTTAQDGVEGLALARSQRFDLVSTDVMMPRMDGYELTRALRATAEYRDTPIVMVTSRGERIDRVRGFDAGVDEYITKPHDRALLLRVVNQLLGRGEPS